MLVERSEGYKRSSDIPHVYAAIYHQSTRGDVILPLGAPLDVAYRGDGVYGVFQGRFVRQIPHLENGGLVPGTAISDF